MRRATDFRPFLTVDRGFTLVEMIVAIVITGVLVGMVGIFGRRQIEAYFDITNRAELSDAADTALRRIARDLQAALPNSVRNDSANFLEFVPIADAGRYRADIGGVAIANNPGCSVQPDDDPLEFPTDPNRSFDVLGPPIKISAGDRVVIFNLGQPGSDVYEMSSSRIANTTGGALCKVGFDGAPFPLASPQNRFQIVGAPITYECAPPNIVRHRNYGFVDPQPTTFATSHLSEILVDHVESCTFSYVPAVLQRNGLVVLRLKLTLNGESVELLQQVDVLNTP